jgi:transcriptional regulator NrdR family protein
VRFASVYRRFEDVGEFMEELKSLIARERREKKNKAGKKAKK